MPERRRRWRILRRALMAAGAGALVLAVWAAFAPVPVGWLINLGVRLGAGGDLPVRVGVGAATFRWQWGEAECDLQIRDLAIDTRSRGTLAQVRHMRVAWSKVALKKSRWLPARMTLDQPGVFIDFKGQGWPSEPLAPDAGATTASTPAAAVPDDLAEWRAFLPLPDAPFLISLRDFTVGIKAPSREVTWKFGSIETALACDEHEMLRIEVDLSLEGRTGPLSFSGSAEGSLSERRVRFATKIPLFRTESLPALPFDAEAVPAIALGVGFEASGEVDLARMALEDLRFRFRAEDGVLNLPDLKPGGPIRLERIEIAGRASDNLTRIEFEPVTLAMDSIRLALTEAAFVQGDVSSIQGHLKMTGPAGTDLAAWLPAATRAGLPVPPATWAELELAGVETRIEARFTQKPVEGLRIASLQLDGQVLLGLGKERVPLALTAVQSGPDKDITARVVVDDVRPSRFSSLAMVRDDPFVAALDLPVRIETEITATPAGEWKSAAMTLQARAGIVRAVGPLRADLPVRSMLLRAGTPDAGRTIAISSLAIDCDGPVIKSEGIQLTAPAPGQPLAMNGKIQIENVSGDFVARFAPPEASAELLALGLASRDWRANELALTFSAAALADAAGQWQLQQAAWTGTLAAMVQGEGLAVDFDGEMGQPSGPIKAHVRMADFRPAAMQLRLPGELPLSAFDLPVRLEAWVEADPDGTLRRTSARVAAGAGTVHAAHWHGPDLAVTSLQMEAETDGAFNDLRVKSLVLDAGGIRVTAEELRAQIGPGTRVSGRVAVEGLNVRSGLSLWPADFQPEWREQFRAAAKSGELVRAHVLFSATIDEANPAATRPTELTAAVRMANLTMALPHGAGEVRLGGLALDVEYPKGVVTVSGVIAPGLKIDAAEAHLTGLDGTAPAIEARADYSLDMAALATWASALELTLPADAPLRWADWAGKVAGTARLSGPLLQVEDLGKTALTADATVSGLRIPLTFPGYEIEGGAGSLHATNEAGRQHVNLKWRDLQVGLPHSPGGAVDLELDLMIDPDADSIAGNLGIGAERLRFGFSGTHDIAIGNLGLELAATGLMKATSADLSLRILPTTWLGLPVALAGNAVWSTGEGRLRSAILTELRFGRSSLAAKADAPANRPMSVSVTSELIDVPELLVAIAPLLSPTLSKPSVVASSGVQSTTPAVAAAPPVVSDANAIEAQVRIARVDFGGGHSVQEIAAEGRLENEEIVSATVRATEGRSNPLRLELRPKAGSHAVTLSIADVPAWIGTLAPPLSDHRLANASFQSTAEQLMKVPTIFAGGRLELAGDLRMNDPARLFDGKFSLADTTLVRPPVMLQLLALKTRRSLQKRPVVKELVAGRFFLNDRTTGIERLSFVADGLPDLALAHATYGLIDDKIVADGKFLGIGFEVDGLRTAPQIYLKENMLIRMVGSEDEFDFGAAEAPAAKSK